MNNMMDSITILQTQMASLLADPDHYQDEVGPAVRERVFSHAQDSDRL